MQNVILHHGAERLIRVARLHVDMGKKVAVPAATLKRIADSAEPHIEKSKEMGHHNTADDIRRAVDAARENASGHSANFVGINAIHATTLTAFSNDRDERKVMRKIIEKFGIW